MMLAKIGAVFVMIVSLIAGSGSWNKEYIHHIFSSDSLSIKSFDELYDYLKLVLSQQDEESVIDNHIPERVTSVDEKTEETSSEDNKWQQEETSEYYEQESEPVTEKETEAIREEITTWKPDEEQTTHIHNWTSITEKVHHDEVTEIRWVVDTPEWTEEIASTVPITEDVFIRVATCRMCGAAFEDADLDNAVSACHKHIIDQHDNACGYGLENSYYATRQIGSQEVVEYVVHPEVGHNETVTIKAAYDETITTGYICSCGEMKYN